MKTGLDTTQPATRRLPVFCADCRGYISSEYDLGVHDSLHPDHATSVQQSPFADDCPHHPGSPFKFYCPHHELLCCAECKDSHHAGCPVMEITRVKAKKAKADLHKIIERLEKGVGEVKRSSSIASRHAEFEKSFSRIRDEIASVFGAARAALDAREKDLLDELDTIYRETSNPGIERRVRELSRTEKALACGKKFLQEPWTEDKKKELLMRLCNVKNEEAVFLSLDESLRDVPVVDFHCDKSFIEATIGSLGAFSVSKRIKAETVRVEAAASDNFTVSWPPPVSVGKDVKTLYEAELSPSGKNAFKPVYSGCDPAFTAKGLTDNTSYDLRVRSVPEKRDGADPGEWSKVVRVKTTWKWACRWKECPSSVDQNKKYEIKDPGPKTVVSKLVNGDWCTAIGDTPIPTAGITHWGIRLLGENNDSLFVGVAPSDIDQNDNRNINNCGWYFDCYDSTLWSGFPHFMYHVEYGPKNLVRQHAHKGDVIDVSIDMPKGDLSFTVNGTDLGVAYKGIPLDKPLVPCVLLRWKNDSIGLVLK